MLSDSEFLGAFLDICLQNKVVLVIPTIDTELQVLADNREAFEKHGVQLLISSVDFIKTCRNKRAVHDFFLSRDIKVAEEFLKEDYRIPMFIKPIDGSGGTNAEAILTEEQLKAHHVLDKNLMFLEYIDKSEFDEFTCDLFYDRDGHLRCVVPRQRLEVRDGEVSKALTVKDSLESFIRSRLSEISGARGCLTLQVFRRKQSDEVIGIEINPRFGGGYPLSYKAGANLPKWIIQEYLLDKPIEDQFDSWEPGLLMLRYDKEILTHGYKG